MSGNSSCHNGPLYPSHEKELARLNRIAGQIDGIKRMIDERRYCHDILVQLRAIRSAVKAVEANVLETYLASCVAESFASGDENGRNEKILELTELFKRFD